MKRSLSHRLNVLGKVDDALLERGHECDVCISGFWSCILNDHVAIDRNTCKMMVKMCMSQERNTRR